MTDCYLSDMPGWLRDLGCWYMNDGGMFMVYVSGVTFGLIFIRRWLR